MLDIGVGMIGDDAMRSRSVPRGTVVQLIGWT